MRFIIQTANNINYLYAKQGIFFQKLGITRIYNCYLYSIIYLETFICPRTEDGISYCSDSFSLLLWHCCDVAVMQVLFPASCLMSSMYKS